MCHAIFDLTRACAGHHGRYGRAWPCSCWGRQRRSPTNRRTCSPIRSRWHSARSSITTEPTIQLKGDTSNGDKVDFDEALGGGDSQRIRLDSFWRFGDSGRHKVKSIAFDMSRDNSKTWDRDIEWGGDVYPVGAKVDAEFSFTVIEVAYEYAFLQAR